MKNIILLTLLCITAGYSVKAQNAVNATNCDIVVTAICYDPTQPCPPCPCPVMPGGGSFAIFYYFPPMPAPFIASASVVVPGNSSVPLPTASCPPGYRMAYEMCTTFSGNPACTNTTCAIVEMNATTLSPASCFTDHGPIPYDTGCNENCWGTGADHYCVCFGPSGDLILGY